MNYPFYQEVIFTQEECKKIIEYSKVYPASAEKRKLEPIIDLENSRIDDVRINNKNEKIGKCFYVYDIPKNENTEWIFEKLLDWFQKVTSIKLKKEKTVTNITLLNYKTGDFFMKHKDIYPGFEWRRWTINIQLDNQYKGGDYILYSGDKEIVLNKNIGNTIAYWAGTEHEVKEITEGERWSIVCSVNKYMIHEQEKKMI
jgi:hypothetical protein